MRSQSGYAAAGPYTFVYGEPAIADTEGVEKLLSPLAKLKDHKEKKGTIAEPGGENRRTVLAVSAFHFVRILPEGVFGLDGSVELGHAQFRYRFPHR